MFKSKERYMNGPGRIHEIGHTPNFSPTIIIIDDDHEVVENIYRVLLEEAGYRVLSACLLYTSDAADE